MKRIIIFIIIIALLVVCLTGCNDKKNDNVIRLNEVTHSVFYAPLYVAINKGFFAEEGLEIELTNGGGADKSMTAVMSNQADIGFMGPEAAVYVKLQGSNDYPIIFGQLTKKDGSFLVGRTVKPSFQWSDLVGSEIIGGRRGGMPAMSLEYALSKNNIKDQVTINYDVQFDLITAAFEGGTGDYCTMFEPGASQYVAQGKGHIIASVGQEAGEIPYTCFMATKSYIKNNKEKVTKFMKAIIKAINFVSNNDAQTVADTLKASFPSTDLSLLVSSVESYKSIDAYMTSPIMTQANFEHMLDILESCGIIQDRVSFSDMIDNSIVEKLE